MHLVGKDNYGICVGVMIKKMEYDKREQY